MEFDVLVTVAGLGSFVVAAVIMVVHYFQHQLQKRTTSANVALQIMATVQKTKVVNEAFYKLHTSGVPVRDPGFLWLLSSLDAVAIFWKEGTITDAHIREFFGFTLKRINDNPEICDFLKTIWDADPSVVPSFRMLLEAYKQGKL